MARLKDPVDRAEKEDADLESLDPASLNAPQQADGLTLDDLSAIPDSAARTPHPFEGYPRAGKVRVGDAMVSRTDLIILRNGELVSQDPSGRGVTWYEEKKDDKGRVVDRVDKVVDLKTYHSRMVATQTGNVDVVFDRTVMVDGREMFCAVVPNPEARAQVCFFFDSKAQRVRVSKDYVLADGGQISRLRRVFEGIHYQMTKSERLARRFDTDPSDQDRTE